MAQNIIDQLRPVFRGELIASKDPGYDSARRVYNAMIDKHPMLIARCTDAADVVSAINVARDSGVTLAVRSGGHSAAGLGVWDDALVVDLQPIRYVRVDPYAATVRVGGGCTWGDVDHATHQFGLAVPSGFVSSTGVGGLTLGGGLGYLTRKYGLTIDNLLSADIVLADGTLVTASETENPDLFWAIRGGGGNFGVAISFLFRAHRVHTDYAGPMLWDLERAPELLNWYRDFIVNAPEDLNGFLAFLVVPPSPHFPEHLHGRKMCAIVWCYLGPLDTGEKVFSTIRLAHPAAVDLVGPMPHPALQSLFDALLPAGLHWYWKSDFFNQINDEAIRQHLTFAQHIPTLRSTMHLYPIDGAAHRIANDATPWAFRNAKWAEVIVGVGEAAEWDAVIDWAKDYWEALHPFSTGGAYVNFMMEGGKERVKATYGENYERLAKVKSKYDPENLFHTNLNIEPTLDSVKRRKAG